MMTVGTIWLIKFVLGLFLAFAKRVDSYIEIGIQPAAISRLQSMINERYSGHRSLIPTLSLMVTKDTFSLGLFSSITAYWLMSKHEKFTSMISVVALILNQHTTSLSYNDDSLLQ